LNIVDRNRHAHELDCRPEAALEIDSANSAHTRKVRFHPVAGHTDPEEE